MLQLKNRIILVTLLVGALLLAAFTGSARAQAGTTLSFDPAASDTLTTCPLDTFDLAVQVADVTNLTAYHLELSFNTGVVEVLDVVNGGLLVDPLDQNLYEPTNGWDNTAGTITFGMAQQGTWQANPPATGSGSLIVITMKALVPNQAATFTLNAANSMLVSWPDAMPIAFTVSGTGVVNTNSCSPTDILLSNDSIYENKPVGTTIGYFTSVDPDSADTTFVYSLVDSENYPDNANFEIVGGLLKSKQVFNYEAMTLPPVFTILVRTTDPWGAYYEEEFTIHLLDANDPPVLGTIGNQNVMEGNELTFTAAGTDEDGDALTYSLVGTVPAGAVIDPLTGVFTWTPTEAQGPASYTFTVRVSDGLAYDEETITIVVQELNTAPAAVADVYTTNEDVTLTVPAPGVLSNDVDADGNSLSAVLVSDVAHGTLALAADGSFTYTPNANFNGTDSFTYKANDGLADSSAAAVTITVTPVNDAPTAVDDFYTLKEDEVLIVPVPGVLANDTDIDLDTMLASLVTGVSHGTLALLGDGSFTYTPAPNFYGTDSFVYKLVTYPAIQDMWTDEATVTITVTPVNDAPVAVDDFYMVDEDGVLTVPVPGVLANDTDIDLDNMAVALVAGVSHGRLVLKGDGSFVYTPALDFYGTDSFVYQLVTYPAIAAAGWTDEATVFITVNPVNDAPVAVDDTYSTPEDTELVIFAAGVLANDTDVDGDPLTAVLVAGPAHGSLTLNADGSFTYMPEADFFGSDSFTYTANDGQVDSNTATVTIQVGEVNDWPEANDDAYETTAGVTLDVAAPGVLENDVLLDPNETVTLAVTGQPAHGTLTLNNDGSFTYVPAPNFFGVDSFGYQLTSRVMVQGEFSDTAVVTITVLPVASIFLPMIVN